MAKLKYKQILDVSIGLYQNDDLAVDLAKKFHTELLSRPESELRGALIYKNFTLRFRVDKQNVPDVAIDDISAHKYYLYTPEEILENERKSASLVFRVNAPERFYDHEYVDAMMVYRLERENKCVVINCNRIPEITEKRQEIGLNELNERGVDTNKLIEIDEGHLHFLSMPEPKKKEEGDTLSSRADMSGNSEYTSFRELNNIEVF